MIKCFFVSTGSALSIWRKLRSMKKELCLLIIKRKKSVSKKKKGIYNSIQGVYGVEMMLFLDLIMEAVKYVIAGYALFGRKVKTRHGLGIIVAACGIVFVGNIADSAGKASVLILPFF